jgi:hypothetical protein
VRLLRSALGEETTVTLDERDLARLGEASLDDLGDGERPAPEDPEALGLPPAERRGPGRPKKAPTPAGTPRPDDLATAAELAKEFGIKPGTITAAGLNAVWGRGPAPLFSRAAVARLAERKRAGAELAKRRAAEVEAKLAAKSTPASPPPTAPPAPKEKKTVEYQWITVDEAAKRLCVQKPTVSVLFGQGKLVRKDAPRKPGVGGPQSFLYRADTVDELVKSRANGVAGAGFKKPATAAASNGRQVKPATGKTSGKAERKPAGQVPAKKRKPGSKPKIGYSSSTVVVGETAPSASSKPAVEPQKWPHLIAGGPAPVGALDAVMGLFTALADALSTGAIPRARLERAVLVLLGAEG